MLHKTLANVSCNLKSINILFFLDRPLHELYTLWYKDSILIDTAGVEYTLSDAWNRTLSLVNANLTHTGKYSCQAGLLTGGYPTVEASADVTVLG